MLDWGRRARSGTFAVPAVGELQEGRYTCVVPAQNYAAIIIATWSPIVVNAFYDLVNPRGT